MSIVQVYGAEAATIGTDDPSAHPAGVLHLGSSVSG